MGAQGAKVGRDAGELAGARRSASPPRTTPRRCCAGARLRLLQRLSANRGLRSASTTSADAGVLGRRTSSSSCACSQRWRREGHEALDSRLARCDGLARLRLPAAASVRAEAPPAAGKLSSTSCRHAGLGLEPGRHHARGLARRAEALCRQRQRFGWSCTPGTWWTRRGCVPRNGANALVGHGGCSMRAGMPYAIAFGTTTTTTTRRRRVTCAASEIEAGRARDEARPSAGRARAPSGRSRRRYPLAPGWFRRGGGFPADRGGAGVAQRRDRGASQREVRFGCTRLVNRRASRSSSHEALRTAPGIRVAISGALAGHDARWLAGGAESERERLVALLSELPARPRSRELGSRRRARPGLRRPVRLERGPAERGGHASRRVLRRRRKRGSGESSAAGFDGS